MRWLSLPNPHRPASGREEGKSRGHGRAEEGHRVRNKQLRDGSYHQVLEAWAQRNEGTRKERAGGEGESPVGTGMLQPVTPRARLPAQHSWYRPLGQAA